VGRQDRTYRRDTASRPPGAQQHPRRYGYDDWGRPLSVEPILKPSRRTLFAEPETQTQTVMALPPPPPGRPVLVAIEDPQPEQEPMPQPTQATGPTTRPQDPIPVRVVGPSWQVTLVTFVLLLLVLAVLCVVSVVWLGVPLR